MLYFIIFFEIRLTGENVKNYFQTIKIIVLYSKDMKDLQVMINFSICKIFCNSYYL
ncbi:hypothetical protein NARC_70014 [Candidatus Nitrosocosmicus arcticus]|uniref:Uncharacterized protein n=1 Tax=Candidatus Nitrosocosmicus arcticus TaxID=2035267 RepID=A0A557SV08_9ARCH|nr:hypothetical protein NARC_70014 [Candidatus Nitrosocosmicus arcticus]